jgi:molybdopterin/thiamine biosynthesis adenylyltransferase
MGDSRYSRLERFAGLRDTLPRWRQSSCAVIGLGGLGAGLAQHLARLGVARLVLIDRDAVGPENLGHQLLYTTEQAEAGLPKAHAAAELLGRVNPDVELVPCAAEVNRRLIGALLDGVQLVFDGLDNYYTRLQVNDWALSTGTPFFYAGVVRGELSAHAVVPGLTACLRCLVDRPPAPGEAPTCASSGVFPPLLAVANALQLDAANRFLAGRFSGEQDVLYSLTLADWRLVRTPLGGPHADCPACNGRYEYLDGELDHLAVQACTGDQVLMQLQSLELGRVAKRLAAGGKFTLRRNRYCLVAEADGLRYTIFPEGRVILEGSREEAKLNRFAAEYLGS